MYVVTTYRAEEDAEHRSAVNSEMQSRPGGAQDAPGGIPRPGGVWPPADFPTTVITSRVRACEEIGSAAGAVIHFRLAWR